jgi:gamma-glutamyltranspeptidase/glutathione hydrolase
LGDPQYVSGLEALQKEWIDPAKMKERSLMIDDEKTFPPEYYKPPKCVLHGLELAVISVMKG